MLWSDEHQEIRRSAERFIEAEVNPFVDEWEREGIFPAHELFRKLGREGFLGIHKPVEHGGMGLDYSYQVAFSESLGHIRCGGVPMAIGVQTDMATPALARFGSEALKAEFLAPAIAGEQVACIGVSEPGAGSDVASIRTHARKDGGDYVINGQKMWITNSTQADWVCLLVNTGDGPPHRNKSLVCVPLDTPGVTRGERLDKLGMRSSDTAPIYFDEVRVPQRFRIGEENRGFTYQMIQFQEERLWAAAAKLVSMERAIRETQSYTGERQAFGRSLLENQHIQFTLAELQSEVECLRSLVYRAVELYVAGQDVTPLASMAKLRTGRLARRVADECLQFWGGTGYLNETPISRFYRDSRLTSIGGGADEIMLTIIARHMGMPRP